METEDRWEFIGSLDDQLLKGGVTLSEWCSFIVREVDYAFVGGSHLGTIVLAVAAIETYLRSEYGRLRRLTLFESIEQSPINDSLKYDIHALRKYRNRWVHVSDPTDDQELLDHPEKYDTELELMARSAIRTLRQVIYENQWV